MATQTIDLNSEKVLARFRTKPEPPPWVTETQMVEPAWSGDSEGGHWCGVVQTVAGEIEVSQFLNHRHGDVWTVSPAHVELDGWGGDLNAAEARLFAAGLIEAAAACDEADLALMTVPGVMPA